MAKIKVPVRTMMETDIHPIDAFRILCQTLDMSYVLNEFVDFIVEKGEDGENHVYRIINGKKDLYDDRGDLFVALRNVAACMVPNMGFRSADYIYNKD